MIITRNGTIITIIDGLTNRVHYIATQKKILLVEKFAEIFVIFYLTS
jgi:hypothetical protein